VQALGVINLVFPRFEENIQSAVSGDHWTQGCPFALNGGHCIDPGFRSPDGIKFDNKEKA
jgi:hypothetical protein